MTERQDRLIALATLLEDKVPTARLTLSWGIPVLPKGRNGAGCILGWALSIKEFRDLGLTLTEGEGVTLLTFGEAHGLEAARQFFGLTPTETWQVFTPTQYLLDGGTITPQLIASRLRALAAPSLQNRLPDRGKGVRNDPGARGEAEGPSGTPPTPGNPT